MTRYRPQMWGAILACGVLAPAGLALEKPDTTYPVFQFPADQIPRIDGNPDDWAIVPEQYIVGSEQLHHEEPRPELVRGGVANLEVRVRVGWVQGLNRLYFLYEASDDFWDFEHVGLRNDTFEIIVDGDASGGPLIDKAHREFWIPQLVGEPAARPDERISDAEAHWAIHGVHAQNYHIFTPAVEKEWALAWGAPTWIKDLPWANAAQAGTGRPGEGGRRVLEFWITPFDYAGPEGPARAVPSVLREGKIIGLSWIVIDYDGPEPRGFWTLSPARTSYGHAAQLCAFRLMPLEPALRPALAARWSWQVVDADTRRVAFRDESAGTVTAWRWDFGDGRSSDLQYPEHTYAEPGTYNVTLEVTGPAGTRRWTRVGDVRVP